MIQLTRFAILLLLCSFATSFAIFPDSCSKVNTALLSLLFLSLLSSPYFVGRHRSIGVDRERARACARKKVRAIERQKDRGAGEREGDQARPGWAPDGLEVRALWIGSRWAGGSCFVPVTVDFGAQFPNEKNQGKHAHHVFKYLVAQRVPTPRAQLCPRSCRINTHER